MFAWYKELRADERRTFWACFGGWATDALDVQIYSFVIPALISLWNLSKPDAGLLATSALLSLPLGQAIGIYAIIAYATAIVAALILPETRGRELRDVT